MPFLFLYSVLDVISILVQCRPTSKIWDREISGSCWNPKVQVGFAYMQGGLSMYIVQVTR